MIQRVQTLYLALATLCGLLTFVLPYAGYFVGDVKVAEYAMFGVFRLQSDVLEMSGPYVFPAWALGILCTLAPIAAITQYKRRPVQHKLARLCMLSFTGYVVYLLFGINEVHAVLFGESQADTLHQLGFYMPVAALALCFLAIRGIRKDEALVKSLDRIR